MHAYHFGRFHQRLPYIPKRALLPIRKIQIIPRNVHVTDFLNLTATSTMVLIPDVDAEKTVNIWAESEMMGFLTAERFPEQSW
jgi:hypothetical protein